MVQIDSLKSNRGYLPNLLRARVAANEMVEREQIFGNFVFAYSERPSAIADESRPIKSLLKDHYSDFVERIQ
jgi:hypothetical protein